MENLIVIIGEHCALLWAGGGATITIHGVSNSDTHSRLTPDPPPVHRRTPGGRDAVHDVIPVVPTGRNLGPIIQKGPRKFVIGRRIFTAQKAGLFV